MVTLPSLPGLCCGLEVVGQAVELGGIDATSVRTSSLMFLPNSWPILTSSSRSCAHARAGRRRPCRRRRGADRAASFARSSLVAASAAVEVERGERVVDAAVERQLGRAARRPPARTDSAASRILASGCALRQTLARAAASPSAPIASSYACSAACGSRGAVMP